MYSTTLYASDTQASATDNLVDKATVTGYGDLVSLSFESLDCYPFQEDEGDSVEGTGRYRNNVQDQRNTYALKTDSMTNAEWLTFMASRTLLFKKKYLYMEIDYEEDIKDHIANSKLITVVRTERQDQSIGIEKYMSLQLAHTYPE